MVWPFSSWSGNDTGSSFNSSPPTLDPKLQDFVKAQGSSTYKTSSTAPPRPPPQPVELDPNASSTPSRPPYASRSAFSDGRYDHLWATYRSPAEVDNVNKTDNEKASDILDFHRARNSSLKNAAIENCNTEIIAQWNCTNHGTWAKKATMCREEVREIGRCMLMQGRFLRALGYQSEIGRPPEVEEDIQIHADDLYRKMLKMERRAEQAKKEGADADMAAEKAAEKAEAEVQGAAWLTRAGRKKGQVEQPLQGQVFWPADAVDKPDDPALPAEVEGISQNAITAMKEKLKPLTPLERALERAAIVSDIKQATDTMKDYDYYKQRELRERQERRDAGIATLGDRISGMLGR